MKITDSLIRLFLKNGILGEFENFRTEIDIPGETQVKITITADNLQIKMAEGE